MGRGYNGSFIGGEVVRLADRSFPGLCAAIRSLAHADDAIVKPNRGGRWERHVNNTLLLNGFGIRTLSPGSNVYGVRVASGLRHQIDAEIRCRSAFVIGEWKSYTG